MNQAVGADPDVRAAQWTLCVSDGCTRGDREVIAITTDGFESAVCFRVPTMNRAFEVLPVDDQTFILRDGPGAHP